MMTILIRWFKGEPHTLLMAQAFLDAKQILERAARAKTIEPNLGYFFGVQEISILVGSSLRTHRRCLSSI